MIYIYIYISIFLYVIYITIHVYNVYTMHVYNILQYVLVKFVALKELSESSSLFIKFYGLERKSGLTEDLCHAVSHFSILHHVTIICVVT